MRSRLVLMLATLFALVWAPTLPAAAGLGGPQAPAVTPPGTAFTYHGQLQNNGAPVNGSCALAFRLFDDPAAGTQVGQAVTTTVVVTAGEFNAPLDFGGGVFRGQALWLDLQVQCGGDPSFTPLSPRSAVTAVPYAQALPGLRTEPNATSPNVIGGALNNAVSAGLVGASIGGGGNSLVPNRVGGNFGTVAGGLANAAGGALTTVGGGRSNTASGDDATVSGGLGNTASGAGAALGGGGWDGATQAGNTAGAAASTVGGGLGNVINPAASYAAIGGGRGNTASAQYATIAGGHNNVASAVGSFAAGQGAVADEVGSFVWSDGTAPSFGAEGPNSFNVVATGGIYLFAGQVDCSLTDMTGWDCLSDRNRKENFTPLDTRAILAAVSRLPVTEWNVKGAAIKHIGPTAQDFHAAFNIGLDDRHLNTVDVQGVALAAIQGLNAVVQDQSAQLAAQRQANADLQARVAALEHKVGGGQTAAAAGRLPLGWVLFGALALLNVGGLAGYGLARRRSASPPAPLPREQNAWERGA